MPGRCWKNPVKQKPIKVHFQFLSAFSGVRFYDRISRKISNSLLRFYYSFPQFSILVGVKFPTKGRVIASNSHLGKMLGRCFQFPLKVRKMLKFSDWNKSETKLELYRNLFIMMNKFSKTYSQLFLMRKKRCIFSTDLLKIVIKFNGGKFWAIFRKKPGKILPIFSPHRAQPINWWKNANRIEFAAKPLKNAAFQ